MAHSFHDQHKHTTVRGKICMSNMCHMHVTQVCVGLRGVCYNIKTVFPGIPLILGIWNYMTKTRWLVSVRLHFNIKTVFPGTPNIGNSITKTRWSHDHLSLNNGNSIIGMMGYLHWDSSYKLFDPIWQHLGHDELTSSNWLRQKRLPNWLSYYHWQHHR